MIGNGVNDPWELLRRHQLDDDETAPPFGSAQDFGERGSRRGARRSRAAPFDGADRLWAASAGVLAALGQLVEVAEEICKERAAEAPSPQPRQSSKSAPDRHSHDQTHDQDRFETVMFLDDDPASATDNGSNGGTS